MNRSVARIIATCFVAILVAVSGTSDSLAQSGTLFSVGPGGLSGLDTNTIFLAPGLGAGPPVPVGGGPAMGLMDTADVIGSFSQRVEVPSGEFLFCFSVTPDTVGGASPLIDFPLPGISFNVMQQASLDQQAGDAFISLTSFDRMSGPITRSGGISNNVLVINQSRPYVANFGLMPMSSPTTLNISGGLDDVRGGATVPVDMGGPVVADFFFTLEPGSPSLVGLSGAMTPSAAHIFFDPTPDAGGMPGDEGFYATAADLGLLTADIIDALSVFDDDGNGLLSDGDQILYSLAAGSPSLGTLGAGPGDVISATAEFGSLTTTVFATASLLGLDPDSSNINMLVPVPVPPGVDPLHVVQGKLIPEPGCLVLVAIGLPCLLRRRRPR